MWRDGCLMLAKYSRVDAISLDDGSLIWSSPIVEGVCAGTPVLSSVGDYVFFTHNNLGRNTGAFTILQSSNGGIFYNFTDDQPFSPPAIEHNPVTGNYVGGEGNTNDIVVFANTLYPSETGVSAGAGFFAFQFPRTFAGSNTGLSVVTLSEETDWKVVVPPTITDGGRSMYWGVSRGDLLAWNNREFSRPRGSKIGLGRGTPLWQPIHAEIATNQAATMLYSGGAGNAFACLMADDLTELWTMETDSPVFAKPLLSPDDSVVYIIEESGVVQARDTLSGDQLWQADATIGTVVAGFAQSAAGDMIYFADSNGVVNGWRVAVTVPTAPVAPTNAPLPETLAPVTAAPVAPTTLAPVVVSNGTVLDVVLSAEPPLTMLAEMATALNATGALASPDFNGTVFAPSDEAFTFSLDEDYTAKLIADPSWLNHLECLVSHHLIPNFTDVTGLWKRFQSIDSASTIQFGSSHVLLGNDPDPSVNGIPVNETDKLASNGIVQFLTERVLLPECVTMNILDRLESDLELTNFTKLLQDTGVAGNLVMEGPFTVFAPPNAAFAALPADVMEYLMDPANLDDLRGVLFHHIVRGNVLLNDDEPSVMTYPTTNVPETVEIIVSPSGECTVSDVDIGTKNILAMNGVIHVAKEVLFPTNLGLPTDAPLTSSPVTAAPATAAPVTTAPVTKGPTSSPTPAPTPGPTLAPAEPTPMPTQPSFGPPTTPAPQSPSSSSSRGIAATFPLLVVVGSAMFGIYL